MAWNFLAVLAHGATTGGAYPVADGSKIGIRQLPDDTHPVRYDIFATNVLRKEGEEPTSRVYHVSGAAGSIIITDKRIAVSYPKVPTNKSMFVPVQAVQAIANRGKHFGESLVGHLSFDQISEVCARNFSPGIAETKYPALRFATRDQSGPTVALVVVEVFLTGRTKAAQIADDLVRRLVAQRIQDPRFASDVAKFDEWRSTMSRPFAPAARQFDSKSFNPFYPVRF